MTTLAAIVGVALVVLAMADLVNTLVTTSTSRKHWWPSSVLYRNTWRVMRTVARAIPNDRRRESVLSTFAPASVLLLLVMWVTAQVIGFGLLWWASGGVDGAGSLFDDLYYSGVIYFTLGFGELVPIEVVPRVGALVEAMFGVLTTALVIGYLPALYSAYSERERKLMTLDDGTEGRITPTNLLLSRAPTGDVDEVVRFFEGWEEWVSGLLETHTTFPMLRLFRSKQPDQNWVTALGVLCDAALQCQVIIGARDRAPYWMLRRSILLFNELTADVDLSDYRARLDETYAELEADDDTNLFRQLYDELTAHGFELMDYETAKEETRVLRRLFDAQMEYLIDALLCPRGFWGHRIGHRPGVSADLIVPASDETLTE
ncbi:MAG: potassium channel family protein [Actinomycetota bacterium]